jgi:hypothetical protein
MSDDLSGAGHWLLQQQKIAYRTNTLAALYYLEKRHQAKAPEHESIKEIPGKKTKRRKVFGPPS